MNRHYPLFHLPEDLELILFLIREQLKSRKFFDELAALGLTDSSYQSHFESLILRKLEMDDRTDELYKFFTELIGKHSQELDGENETLMNAAMSVYGELIERRGYSLEDCTGERHK
jgi:hypothetical protein